MYRNAFLAMIAVVALSNYLVQFPINDWLTWGAFPYPVSFLITELTNRFYGPKAARQVVYVGFIVAAILSIAIATPKIALASLTAFFVSQMLDIAIFNKLRQATWWQAPLLASTIASTVDATIFWSIAFFGEPMPILTWAIGDTIIKLLLDVFLLTPFRLMIRQKTAVCNFERV
jgi:uncharacterized PurR-regulated membrane protein YhhQ (DUF165 family)